MGKFGSDVACRRRWAVASRASLRITVGTAHENERLLIALDDVLTRGAVLASLERATNGSGQRGASRSTKEHGA